jgi:protease-4
VQASEEIYRELVALHEAHKPLIVSMSNLAASGGYYISAPADEIWASPATITGSIGIFAIVPTIDKTLNKIGVNVDGVGTTPLSGELRMDRPLGEASKALLQAQIDRGYDVFLTRVSTGRKKTTEEVDKIAHGRVWAGQAARDIGLVDQLGSFDDAVKAAARRANLKDYAVDFVEPELSWAQELLQQWRASAALMLLKADGDSLALARVASTLDPLRREMERLSRFTKGDHIYSYCFCNVQ